jgi:septum formation protein
VALQGGGGAGELRLVLASSSPQRRAILERLGLKFAVRAPEVEELERGDPEAVTLENARRKARKVYRAGAGEMVIACDTVVALAGAIYGKPADESEARRTLSTLSGTTHEVVSGLVVLSDGDGSPRERSALARTEVTFARFDEGRLEWYLATGEWRERAGGYAIQGAGAALVGSVRGDYENVVGLPLASLLELCPELLPGE